MVFYLTHWYDIHRNRSSCVKHSTVLEIPTVNNRVRQKFCPPPLTTLIRLQIVYAPTNRIPG